MRAGERLRLAGFSSGRGDCARGDCSAERCGSRAGAVFVLLRSCGSIGMFYVRLTPVMRSCWNVVCSFAPIIRSYRDVLCSITPAVCRIAPNRTACDMLRSYSAVGRDRHSCVLAVLARLSRMAGSLWDCAFLYGDPDGIIGAAGLRNWRRGLCAFLRSRIGFAAFSAGSTLGLRAPDCAKESSTLWTLFTLRRGCVGAYSPRRHPGTRKDPPESNLCSGGSGCTTMIPARSIGDLPDSDLWSGRSCCIARQQVEAALRSGPDAVVGEFGVPLVGRLPHAGDPGIDVLAQELLVQVVEAEAGLLAQVDKAVLD